jgi:hypothetical protein
MPIKLYEADVGSTVRVHDTVTVDDVLTDPGTITVKVMAPDGSVVSTTPIRQSAGRYYWDVSLTDPGIWAARYESTGNEGAEEIRWVCRRSYFP